MKSKTSEPEPGASRHARFRMSLNAPPHKGLRADPAAAAHMEDLLAVMMSSGKQAAAAALQRGGGLDSRRMMDLVKRTEKMHKQMQECGEAPMGGILADSDETKVLTRAVCRALRVKLPDQSYAPAELLAALQLVHPPTRKNAVMMNKAAAARLHGIPYKTMKTHSSKFSGWRKQVGQKVSAEQYLPTIKKRGRAALLESDEEALLAARAIEHEEAGFGQNLDELRTDLASLSQAVGHEGAKGSRRHLAGFMRRNELNVDAVTLKVRKQSKISTDRAKACTPEKIADQFNKVAAQYLEWNEEGRIIGEFPADCLFNTDEMHTGDGKWKRVVMEGTKNDRSFKLQTGERLPFHATQILTCCADGTLLDALCGCIHQCSGEPSEALALGLRHGGRNDPIFHTTSSGSMDEDGWEFFCKRLVQKVGKQHWDASKAWNEQPAADPSSPHFGNFEPRPIVWFLDGFHAHKVSSSAMLCSRALGLASPALLAASPRLPVRARCARLLHMRRHV